MDNTEELADKLSDLLTSSIVDTLDSIGICLILEDDMLDKEREGSTINYSYPSSRITITLNKIDEGRMLVTAVLHGELCNFSIDDPVEAAVKSLENLITMINYGTNRLDKILITTPH